MRFPDEMAFAFFMDYRNLLFSGLVLRFPRRLWMRSLRCRQWGTFLNPGFLRGPENRFSRHGAVASCPASRIATCEPVCPSMATSVPPIPLPWELNLSGSLIFLTTFPCQLSPTPCRTRMRLLDVVSWRHREDKSFALEGVSPIGGTFLNFKNLRV